MRQRLELAVAGLDLGVGQVVQPLEREGLDRKRGHHRAHDDRPAQVRLIEIPRAGQKAQEPARKGIPRPGRVVDLLQRKRRRREPPPVRKAERPVFPPLDDQQAGAPAQNLPGRPDQIRLLCQHPGLGIINYKDLDLLEGPPQRVRLSPNPEIHRVRGDQAGSLHLSQDLAL